MTGGHAKSNIVAYTGLCMCDFDHIAANDMDRLFSLVAADDHTVLAFRTVSGNGIRVVAAFEMEGKDVSQIAEGDYALAFNHVNHYFTLLLGIPFDPATKDSSRLSFLSHDADAYFNASAVPFSIHTAPGDVCEHKTLKDNSAGDVEYLFRKACSFVEQRGISYSDGHNSKPEVIGTHEIYFNANYR